MSKSLQRVSLGTVEPTGKTLSVNLTEFIVTRGLIQANSGGGKSYLLRRLLEQTHGKTQQIIIDVEGEFASLREKFDYIYAAKDGGDTTVDPRGAQLLAERLLELKASAILDIYELRHHDRIRFVHLFLDALVNAPKRLWHPVIIVVDEAHYFCPQVGEAESSEAVMGLCTRGRKRGFCPILATQRLSKLHKDAAAECLNRFIGRTSLDVDMKRASDELGFSTDAQRLSLRNLNPGEFFVFGPAISNEVVRMTGGPVVTTHPKAGRRIRFQPPKPTKHIRALLPKLSDLPAEQATRAQTERELRRELHTAQQEAAALRKSTAPKIISVIKEPHMKRLASIASAVNRAVSTLATVADRLQSTGAAIARVEGSTTAPSSTPTGQTIPAADVSRLGTPMRVLAAIKAYPGATPAKIGAVARVSPRVSTYRLAIVKLRKDNLIRGDNHTGFWLTSPEGEKAAAHLPAPVRGTAAIEQWRQMLGPKSSARQVFEAILAAGAKGITAEGIERDTGIDTKVSTFRGVIGKLKHHNIITGNNDGYRLSENLL